MEQINEGVFIEDFFALNIMPIPLETVFLALCDMWNPCYLI